eukprot:3574770-Prymnesium_polylepis.1
MADHGAHRQAAPPHRQRQGDHGQGVRPHVHDWREDFQLGRRLEEPGRQDAQRPLGVPPQRVPRGRLCARPGVHGELEGRGRGHADWLDERHREDLLPRRARRGGQLCRGSPHDHDGQQGGAGPRRAGDEGAREVPGARGHLYQALRDEQREDHGASGLVVDVLQAPARPLVRGEERAGAAGVRLGGRAQL